MSRVFVSSTYLDLAVHRAVVHDTLLRLDLVPVGMEFWGAQGTGDATSVSTEKVAGADVFLGIVAWRYGSIPEGETRSVTHLEYEQARRLGLPCFIFLSDPSTEAQNAQMDRDQHLGDTKREAQLHSFRAQLERENLLEYFTTPDDLSRKVAAALAGIPRTPRKVRQLPPRIPGFVGREDDLGKLEASLRHSENIVVSALVAGLGGVGKSALAAEILHRLAVTDAFPGGLAWVRCDGRTELEGINWVYDQILGAWGVRVSPDDLRRAATIEAEVELREQVLRDKLHPLGPALVLLDNVEVAFLLARALEHLTAQGIALLITARHRDSLPSMRLVSLDVLARDAAVQLFGERYAARGGQWSPERDQMAALAVVEKLGRLPLAIELAASRAALTGMEVAGLAAELGRPDVLARLQDPLRAEAGVRYSFEKSLTLLETAERRSFAALGLPAGPDWPRPVVDTVLAAIPGARASEELERLAALSLVKLAGARVRLHPLLRALAAEEWGEQPADVQRAGLDGLMVGVLNWATAHQDRDARSYAQLEEDEAMLVGALRRAAAAGASEPMVHTVSALAGYLDDGGHWRVGIEMWTLALQAARRAGSKWNEGTSLTNLGLLYHKLGEGQHDRSCYEQALAIARVVGDRQGESENLDNLGHVAGDRGDYDQARHLHEQALAIRQELGDVAGEARTLNNLGIEAYEQDAHDDARRYYERALAIARELGDRTAEAARLDNLGELALAECNIQEAHRCLDAALPLAHATGSRDVECSILIKLGELARLEGHREAAENCLQKARTINHALGSHEHEANILRVTGQLLRDGGDPLAAQTLFAQALAIFETLDRTFEARRVREEQARL